MSDASAIAASIAVRGISEILHFTTHRGLTGVVNSEGVKAKSELDTDEYLSSIYTPNTLYRNEKTEYLSYVNLSVSHINGRFFDKSGQWHVNEDVYWVVLSLDPSIATHDDVLFATGNMGYAGMTPAAGIAGWDAMFADRYYYGFGKTRPRRFDCLNEWTSDPQAEVLYPRCVPLSALQAVYVEDDHRAARAQSVVAIGQHEVPVLVDPSKFSPERS